ncbi:nitronate monooxygenase [Pseudooceanicola sp. CBS1P-1]|uniref:Nitronate monooxygenase n=1 Tax=Pseudooceanicola albus TaxID=2692189 RepID=A0A6L7G6H9_9RHOB|nr:MULTISPECIES: nitronate monooxygenase family protein [Pseudooceanicola]MBT9383094.1 nitronate monooxygenase [Pseudooceanicola endophyticus]MXN19282.1 nitronate monooxygenase [Pseudooceanicola albus]
MALPAVLSHLRLPLIGSPLFLVSGPELVIAQCKAGIVGAFPALNAREAPGEPVALDRWLTRIREELDRHNQANPDHPAAPFAVNQIVHRSNTRLERDVEICARHEVPVWITSLGARAEVNEAAHAAGGIVLHDVTTDRFAHKAIDKGADGLIAVAAGAGGHAGAQNPFALIREIRDWFDGPLFLSGAIARGESLLAALALGADGGYAGSVFIATEEARAEESYKRMILDCGAEDILSSDAFTGVMGNYLRPSVLRAGLDPALLDRGAMDFGSDKPRTWADIWGSGQGIGAVKQIRPAAEVVARLEAEFRGAQARLAALAGVSAD